MRRTDYELYDAWGKLLRTNGGDDEAVTVLGEPAAGGAM
jgi:hypothetical protein